MIGAALSIAMAAAARRLTPKPEAKSFGRGAHLRLAADAQMPRVVILGEAAVAGSLVYHHTYASTTGLDLVFALADHECDSMIGVWINGKPVTWNSGTGAVTEYPGMSIRFHSGAWSQAADDTLVANAGGRWDTNDRGRGICYVAISMSYNAALYQGRQPNFLFNIRGAKLYDWRLDSTAGGSGSHRWADPSTWAWSDNPAVAWYNYRRGIFVNGSRVAGMATAADALPLADVTAAANACDELVALDGGGSEKRYRISAAIVTAQKHREVIRDIVASCGGEEIDTGGELKLAPGVAQSPVMALTDDDLMADQDVEWSGRQSRRDLINGVYGSYRDPGQRYEAVSLVPRLSSADEVADGGRFEARYDLDMVTSSTQAQRVVEILRRRTRRQGTAKAAFRAKACVLEPGDWITWTSARYGWEAKTFEVVSSAVARDLTTELVLRETDVGVYAWDPVTDELSPGEVPNLPAGGGGITSVSGLTVETISVESSVSVASRPGLRLTWTPITDASVVEIEVEVRREGDVAAIGTRRIYDPAAGQYAFIDGVLGSTDYEVRVRPVTLPVRAVAWTAWVAPPETTLPQVVEVGSFEIPPDTITADQLDAQTRFELQLTTALAEVQGSAAEQIAEAYEWGQRAGEEALRALLDASDAKAQVRVETIQRSTETTALAAQITSVTTEIAGNSASVVEILESLDGITARWGIAVSANDEVQGLVRLDGDASGATFKVLADKFIISLPGAPATTIQAFVAGVVNGVATVGINGNLLVDGSILARHISAVTMTAIQANITEIVAAVLRSSDNKFRIDLAGKTLTIET